MAAVNEILDLVIVGAGVYGICAANTYLQLHPEANIKVIDSDDNAGGVWSTSRLYPKFWSQTGARLSGYPDVPFKVPENAETYHDLFEAKHLSKYLETYVTDHEYGGRPLRDRFVFRTWVTSVWKDGDSWRIKAKTDREELNYETTKLIIATGLSSVPYMPDIPGRDSFQGLILHQKEFGRSKILTSAESDIDEHTHITVLGGSKSASDIAFAAATDPTKSRNVRWIIRTSGQGPLLLNKAQGFGQYRSISELGSIRAMASVSSADPFKTESWWSWFLHKTPIGDWLLQKIWSRVEKDSAALANYDGREGALPGFEGLRHEVSTRWRAGNLGILQSDQFWDTVAKNVQIYRGDVARLTKRAVVLEDGTEVETDVLLCATGWKQEHPYFGVEEAARLGLPISLSETKLVEQIWKHWSTLDKEADQRVLKRWPYLAHVPKFTVELARATPYKLYNLTVSLEDQSVAFLGVQEVPNSYHTALVQTLYAIAVLDGVLELPSRETMEQEVAFSNCWCRRRYPTSGQLGNVLDYEMVSFTDHLLEQLGVSSHRNKGSWWADVTSPCLASDYAGIMDEYKRLHHSNVV